MGIYLDCLRVHGKRGTEKSPSFPFLTLATLEINAPSKRWLLSHVSEIKTQPLIVVTPKGTHLQAKIEYPPHLTEGRYFFLKFAHTSDFFDTRQEASFLLLKFLFLFCFFITT